HVVVGQKAIIARFHQGLEIPAAQVLAHDAESDLAVLRVRGSGFKSLQLTAADRIVPGASIFVISSPLGLEGSLTSGVVSAVREFNGQTLLQISAPVSPGSSGAPVFDSRGQVVGVIRSSVPAGSEPEPGNSFEAHLESPTGRPADGSLRVDPRTWRTGHREA